MSKDVEALIKELDRRQPYVSGATIVEIFGDEACRSWECASALIDAFNLLEETTGEPPNRGHVSIELYNALKSYWHQDLGDDLVKLDNFLGRVSINA